jgi:hypothetical protein
MAFISYDEVYKIVLYNIRTLYQHSADILILNLEIDVSAWPKMEIALCLCTSITILILRHICMQCQ